MFVVILNSCTNFGYNVFEKNVYCYNKIDSLQDGLCMITLSDSSLVIVSKVKNRLLNGKAKIYNFKNNTTIEGYYLEGEKDG